MTEHIGKEFIGWVNRGGFLYKDVRFQRCVFDSCAISLTENVNNRTWVRSIELLDCRTQNHTDVGPAILEEVTIDGLETNDLFILWDPLFRHVTLKGRIGKVKVNPIITFEVDARPSIQVPFDRAKAEYYRNVDWALDISQGLFDHLMIEGVPAHLVRRDPKTQMVVRREKAFQKGWRDKVIDGAKRWIMAIDTFLDDSRQSSSEMIVAATARGGRIDQVELDGLQNLRELGIAEPE